MPCDKIDCQLKIECFDAYGKFKYPPCASESVEPNADNLQQLKAKIASIRQRLQKANAMRENYHDIAGIVEELQQLSA